MKHFLMVSLALLLSACMLVDDFSPEWEKGRTESCMHKIAESLYASEFRRDPAGKDMAQHARVLTVGTQHFLLLKKEADDTGGRMYRFDIVNGIFARYRLNPAMRAAFERDYPNAPVRLQHDTVRLATLDAPVLQVLAEIAAKPDYWEVEDKTLYNSLRNPACTLDDRAPEKSETKKAK